MVNSKMFQQGQLDDIFQHSFYETEVDFYNAPASLPNDDIWKKFELLPTPPLSPRRDNIPPELNLDLEESVYLDIADLLKEHEGNSLINSKTFAETPPSPNLQSKLIQDCMWSGSARTDQFEKKSDKSQTSGYELNTCVDPASVFPYPIHSLSGFASETRVHNLGTETPSDSEEEIDVVNIETQKQQIQPAATRKQTTVTVRTFRSDEIKKEPCDLLQKTVTVRVKVDSPPDVHNYSLPHSHSLKRVRSVPLSPASSPQPVKKLKRELSVPELKRVCQKLQAGSCSGRSSTCSSAASSRNSSDSEESYEGKRTQHNVLERKRRNDLKYSFFNLRDIVPDLTKQERAPKVLILKRATEYIRTLVEDERDLESEKSDLTSRHEQLKRTLARLQSKHFY